MSRAIIFVNGHLPSGLTSHNLFLETDTFISANGGTRNAFELGICPDVVIGDLDSALYADLQTLEESGSIIYRYPPEKDETDLELAIRYAVENKFTVIRIVGALGGRIDQELANLSLLADVPPGVDIRIDDGMVEVFLISEKAEIFGKSGDLVSLVPWGMPVEGITTEGLRYPLSGETLLPNKSRGISNEMISENASVKVQKGTLICVHTRKRWVGTI